MSTNWLALEVIWLVAPESNIHEEAILEVADIVEEAILEAADIVEEAPI